MKKSLDIDTLISQEWSKASYENRDLSPHALVNLVADRLGIDETLVMSWARCQPQVWNRRKAQL